MKESFEHKLRKKWHFKLSDLQFILERMSEDLPLLKTDTDEICDKMTAIQKKLVRKL
jgi:hypothetical protein